MASLEELIAALRGDRLELTAVFTALGERGAVAEQQHRQEVAWLKNQRDDQGFDPDMALALLTKLANLQRVAAQALPGAASIDAATVVQPASGPPGSGGQARDATGSSTSSSVNTSSWQRVAEQAGGEFATVGMLLKGRFLLERELGRGGMGVVYLARDDRKVEARDRDPYVAVKVLNDEFRRHPDSLIALQRETRRSQQLAHDNIVRVYDFDKDGTIVFMTMEYIDGISLKALIREQAPDGMSLAKARPLIEGMAWALKRAHTAGVVHSDFKPGNVLVTKDGVAKVFDFGIARAGKKADAPADEQTLFDAGKLGALTPAYASLDMLRGADPTPADDIYALGCVTYELLTGRHPFDKVSAEVALREGRKPPHVAGLTPRQNRALQKAVAFERAQRLQDVVKLVEGLRNVGLRERVGRPLLIAVVVVVVLIGAGWGARYALRARAVARVVAGFQMDNPQHYVNAKQAVTALASLDEDQRKQLMVAHGDQVQRFLIGRVDAYWDPATGQRDYAAAERVFAAVGKLGLYLPQVDLKRLAIEKQKQTLDHPTSAKSQVAKAAPVPQAAPQEAPAASALATAKSARELQAAEAAKAQQAAEAAKAQQAAAAAKARMQAVAAKLVKAGEHNFALQKYSAAIANAKAALQVDPGDPGARRLLKRAREAQQKAMHSITIH